MYEGGVYICKVKTMQLFVAFVCKTFLTNAEMHIFFCNSLLFYLVIRSLNLTKKVMPMKIQK